MIMSELNPKEKNLLKPFLYWHSVSSNAYKYYLEGRTYGHAQVMRVANQHILDLFESQLGVLTKEELGYFSELSIHYRHWMAQFDDLVEKLRPDAYTEFVFEPLKNSARYPSESVKKLLESLETVR